MHLSEKRCVACEGGVPPLNERQVERYHAEVPEWTVSENKKLSRTFVFKDFAEAMQFVNRVAERAESEGHHPDISVSWNKVVLSLTTHAIGGLSENDFIVAAKINKL
ncbi:MAG: 4a-hydroxytetrahydrobiopterin dehydratase [Candidatus Liptonbacteria bacterium]|nr:4a-hydroxytetrahydrobiopterin dehydratase [Candidatus Liptonbacteria bacterium]MBI3114587.1 4a-hydroxytetrahydrobiopterin dehydratase [Candidatus Harrisonbacteria bacterium]